MNVIDFGHHGAVFANTLEPVDILMKNMQVDPTKGHRYWSIDITPTIYTVLHIL